MMISHAELTGFDMHKTHIEKHWLHAIEKHPYFCDRLLPAWEECNIRDFVSRALEYSRERLKCGSRDGNLMWNEILDCEVWEATEAIVNGDVEQAIEECYDAIAVLMRTIDVLRGKQELGNLKKKGR